MTTEFKLLSAACKLLPGVSVIETSWLSTKRDWSLPAIVIDLENPVLDTTTEDGLLTERQTRFSITSHVKADDHDPLAAIQKLETLFWGCLDKIRAAFPTKQLYVDLPQFDVVPFGKTQAQAFALTHYLRITDGE